MRLGIDFGTTNSAAAVFDGQQLHPIHIFSPKSSDILPSLIYVDRQHHAKLGLEAAGEYAQRETGRAVRWRRKNAGTVSFWVASTGGSPILVTEDVSVLYDDAAYGRLLQSVKTALRNEVYSGTQIFDRFYTLDELIALVLGKLKSAAETQLGEECTEVVIGRPVKFSDKGWVSNRAEEIIYKGARLAGFKAISFNAEPIGALYVYHIAAQTRQRVLVFDFGGGTLDLTVAEVGGGIAPKVLATRGVLVGGDDLDRRIMLSLLKYFGEDPSRNLRLPPEFVDLLDNWQSMPELSRPQHEDTLRTLRFGSKHPETIDALRSLVSRNLGFALFTEIERAKRELTSNLAVTLKFQREAIRIHERITRSQFESMIKPEIRQVREGLEQVMREADVTSADLDAVLRTGGSSLVPAFVRLLEEMFGADRLREMDPMVSVVGGLSIIAQEDAGLWGDYRVKYVDQPDELVTNLSTSGDVKYGLYKMQIGAKCYADLETVIRRIPVELSGFVGIQSAYADRENTESGFLRFKLSSPARIYIAFPTGASNIPHWLRSFTYLNDMTLEVEDEWYGVRRLQLYSQTFPAGEVILGGNNAPGVAGRVETTYLAVVERMAV